MLSSNAKGKCVAFHFPEHNMVMEQTTLGREQTTKQKQDGKSVRTRPVRGRVRHLWVNNIYIHIHISEQNAGKICLS